MRLGNLFIGLALGLATVFSVAHAEETNELYFPVEKSRVKILPQRFEYQLLNKDQIRIGNVLMDAALIDFQIIPVNPRTNRFKLRFRWPAGLLDRGEIAIKDNAGKGIWFQKIQPGQITLSADKTLASYETEAEVPSLLRLVQLYPFFKFCVHREEALTKTYLCSKDLYLRKSKEKDQIVIEKRDSYRPQSFIEINGQPVGNQGVIFLNAPSEFVSLRALLLSGAILELDTRMKNIDFKDVYLSEDESQLVVRAEGTEPVDPSTVEHLAGARPDEWRTHLDVERPFTYLKGEGDLPLRQEFLLQGPVRKGNIKVSVNQGEDSSTYKEEYTLVLKPAKGLRLAAADKQTRLEKIDDGEYRWTLTGLKRGDDNRRFIKVQSGQEEYFAAYEIDRRAAFDGSLRLMAPLWAQAQMLFTPKSHWGFSGQYDHQLMKSNSDDLELKGLTFGAQYRFTQGLHLEEPAYVAELYAQSLQASGKNLSVFGLGLQAEWRSPRWWAQIFPWTFLRLRYPMTSLDSNYPVKASYEAEFSLRSANSNSRYWEVGLRNHKYLFTNDAGDLKSEKTFGFVGMGWIF